MSLRNGFILGEWTVNPLGGGLQRAEESRRVQPKSMDVLLCLADAQGRVVEREQLLRQVWGERAFSDEILTRCIGELRRALGDQRDNPVYIETIPKRGYRLLIPAQAVEPAPASPAESRETRRISARTWIAAALVVAVVVTFMALRPLGDATAPDGASDQPGLATTRGNVPAIAVLPFLNLSPNPADAYLADGTAETLTHVLSRVQGLKVVARSSAFVFREAEDVRIIGDTLNVDAVLEGSVQKFGDAMRITTQLVATADGRHLWSAAYDRDIENLFAVQDEIAGEVTSALQIALLHRSNATREGTVSFEAYREYLLGLDRVQGRTVESIAAAEQHFSRARELDPDYALAHVGYADSIGLQHYYSQRPIADIKAVALPALERALDLEPKLGEAYASLGIIRFYDGDIEGAEIALSRAVALSPNYARAYFGYGSVYNDTGRPAKALAMHLRALDLNPLAPHINNAVGVAFEKLGRFEEAVAQFERTMEIAPDYGAVHYRLGMLKWNVDGDAQAAIRLYEQAIATDRDNPWGPTLMSHLYLDLGDDAQAAEWLEVAERSGETIATAEIKALLLMREGAPGVRRLEIVRKYFDQATQFGFPARFLRIARDAYLEVQQPSEAVGLFRQAKPKLFDENVEINWVNFTSAVDLAYVLQETGEEAHAASLLERVDNYIRTIPRLGCCGYGITDVEIAAIRGETDMALAALEVAIAEGWKVDWWWDTQYNPNLSGLVDNERYQLVLESLAETMTERLAPGDDAAAGPRP